MKKEIGIRDILIGTQENQVVIRIDMLGSIYTQPIREYFAKSIIVHIGDMWMPLADALKIGWSWIDSKGVSKRVWIKRLEMLKRQHCWDCCNRIIAGTYPISI